MRHLRIYRAIRLVHRSGSIRKAAEGLAISPSALNRSIQTFEAELGLPVFDRVPAGVRLTAAGELLVDMLDRHLTEFDDLRTQLVNLRDGLSGTLRITCGSDIGAGLVLSAIHEFEDAFPGVSIELATADDATELHRREADLALLTNPETDAAVEVVHAHRLALAAWRGQAGPGPTPAGLWDIVQQRLLLPHEGTGSRAVISHLLRRHRLAPGTVSAMPAAQLVHHLPGAQRIAIFPETVFEGAAAADRPARLPLDLGHVQLCVLRAARVPMIRPAQAFLTVLQRRLEERDR